MSKSNASELYSIQDIMTPGLHPHQMNKYRSKDGREVIMHNVKTHITTSDGTEWTKCDTRIVVPGSEISTGGYKALPDEDTTKPASSPPANVLNLPAEAPKVISANPGRWTPPPTSNK